eukprot:m.22007 g.22007  ORF g.22007 m.22007 type:complete len:215 (-) comp5753_c0_seq1:1162-1806(-)
MFFLIVNVQSMEGVMLSVLAFVILNWLGEWTVALFGILAVLLATMPLISRMIPRRLLDPAILWVDGMLHRYGPPYMNQFFRENPLGDFFDPTYTARRNRAHAEHGLQQLHREPYRTVEQLRALPARKLREIARHRMIDVEVGPVEKHDLVLRLHLTDPCSICLDTWNESTDPNLDAVCLRCGHVFHAACIQQWVEAAGELGTKRVACPYCTQPI